MRARRRHFVVAFGQGETGMAIAKALVEAGAKLDAVDAKKNTALHYAAGYGRPEYAALLLDAGAPVEAANDTGKTALDLVKLNSANPVGKDEAVMKRLGGGSFFRDV
jgi:ankyrin repeat protein